MNRLLVNTILTTGAIATLMVPPAVSQPESKQIQFFCGKGYHSEIGQEVPTTFAVDSQNPEERKTAVIRWVVDWNREWTPKKRCEVVSPRFQQAYEQGDLNYLSWGWMNNQMVICGTSNFGGPCEAFLLTLREGKDDPEKIIFQLNSVIQGYASSVINQTTGQSQLYIRFDVEKLVNKTASE